MNGKMIIFIINLTFIGFLVYFIFFYLKASWLWFLFGILIYGLIFFFVILRIVRHYFPFPIPLFATPFIDNPLRRKFMQNPEIIAERMQLKPGMIVVDIGPGKGNYTIAVAKRILPDGVIDRLKKRVDKEGITNIIPKIENAYNFSFPDESIDRIYSIGCLPEIPDPVRVLRECKRILKPDGIISLSELFIDPDYPRRKTEINWAEQAGLKLKQKFGTWFSY
ncbi:MAG: class I SAM-dependent methyltransferase [Candidatus Helarchaeota archaeon]